MYQYAYLIGTLLCLLVWLFIYLRRKDLRKEMIFGSLLAAPIGLTEFLFVPEYWNPPSIFDLINKVGFGIESILLGFAAGGIATVVFEYIEKKKLKKLHRHKRNFIPYVVFLLLFLILEIYLTEYSIYNLTIALLVTSALIIIQRKDLRHQILMGGFFFAFIYFFLFSIFNFLFPDFVELYYNTNNLLGIYVAGVPLEEIIFAFSGGACWSTLYEFMMGYKTKTPIISP